MPDWHAGFKSRRDVLHNALAHALADATVMRKLGEEITRAHLRNHYDLLLRDVESTLAIFVRNYLDPAGLRTEESIDQIEADTGVMGAFFIGLLVGWRYRNDNDHALPEEEEVDEAAS